MRTAATDVLANSAGGVAGAIGATILLIAIFITIFAAYWVPSIVALTRHVPDRGSVIVVNALAGWTIAGWIVALAMACRSTDVPAVKAP